jgi:hypothetical protein
LNFDLVNFFSHFCDHPNRDLELIGDTFVENSPKFGQKRNWPKTLAKVETKVCVEMWPNSLKRK